MSSDPLEFDEDDDFFSEPVQEHRASIQKLSRDLAAASRTMGPKEARFLVDAYYTSQNNRKRAANQARSLAKGVEITAADGTTTTVVPEPHVLIDWLFAQSRILESQIKRTLDQYTRAHIMGEWMRQIDGIGPVIAAGILAHLEQPRPTAGRIYAFAGIAGAGQKPWLANTKRPYNVRLKTVCWHAGNSFMKRHNSEKSFYGKLYEKRKAFEFEMSETGQRAAIAAENKLKLEKLKKTDSEAYQHYCSGKLPPAQIDGRARRYAVKIFLSHMNEVWNTKLGRPIVAPFVIAHKGHAHYIPPPIPA